MTAPTVTSNASSEAPTMSHKANSCSHLKTPEEFEAMLEAILDDADGFESEDLKVVRATGTLNSKGENKNCSAEKKRNVAFDRIKIHEFPLLLGDNPSVSAGFPVTISWDLHQTKELSLEEYEANRPQRKTRSNMKLSAAERMRLLLQSGYSLKELTMAHMQHMATTVPQLNNTNESSSSSSLSPRSTSSKRQTRKTSASDPIDISSFPLSLSQSNTVQHSKGGMKRITSWNSTAAMSINSAMMSNQMKKSISFQHGDKSSNNPSASSGSKNTSWDISPPPPPPPTSSSSSPPSPSLKSISSSGLSKKIRKNASINGLRKAGASGGRLLKKVASFSSKSKSSFSPSSDDTSQNASWGIPEEEPQDYYDAAMDSKYSKKKGGLMRRVTSLSSTMGSSPSPDLPRNASWNLEQSTSSKTRKKLGSSAASNLAIAMLRDSSSSCTSSVTSTVSSSSTSSTASCVSDHDQPQKPSSLSNVLLSPSSVVNPSTTMRKNSSWTDVSSPIME